MSSYSQTVEVYRSTRETAKPELLTITITEFPVVISWFLGLLHTVRGDEWFIKIFNCSQNFTFARFARLPVLPKFLRCSQARKANFLFLLVLAKKSQFSACSQRPFVTPTVVESVSSYCDHGDICRCFFIFIFFFGNKWFSHDYSLDLLSI